MAFFEMVKTAIRTVVQKPATILYPAEAAKKTPLSRGHVTIDESRCISCGTCQRKCPAQAIVLTKEGFTKVEPTEAAVNKMIHELIIDHTLG